MCFIPTLFLFIHLAAWGHGFGPETLVIASGSWLSVERLCQEVVSGRETFDVESYDLDAKERCFAPLTAVGHSRTDCYLQVSLSNVPTDDILCSPAQEFYLLHEKRWKAACQLQVGDYLFDALGAGKMVTKVALHQKPLEVYALEVARTHTFFVGIYSVLTHNMMLPAMAITVTIPWGAAAGGLAGGFFGPLSVTFSVAVGSIIGYVWQKCIATRKMAEYEIPCSMGVVGQRFQVGEGNTESVSPCSGPVGPNLFPDPEDPEKHTQKVPKKTVEEVVQEACFDRKTKGNTKQYSKSGGYSDATRDFESLECSNVMDIERGKVGYLSDGRRAIVRIRSKEGRPTLEIQKPNGVISLKIRYGD